MDLKQEVSNQVGEASELHDKRAAEKASLACVIHEMLTEKIEQVEVEIAQMEVDAQPEADPSFDGIFHEALETEEPEEATATEKALEAAVASSKVHQEEAQASVTYMRD